MAEGSPTHQSDLFCRRCAALPLCRDLQAVAGGHRPREERGRRGHHVHPGLPGDDGPFAEEIGTQTESRTRMDLL